jgi:uncharacterized membrane protein
MHYNIFSSHFFSFINKSFYHCYIIIILQFFLLIFLLIFLLNICEVLEQTLTIVF